MGNGQRREFASIQSATDDYVARNELSSQDSRPRVEGGQFSSSAFQKWFEWPKGAEKAQFEARAFSPGSLM